MGAVVGVATRRNNIWPGCLERMHTGALQALHPGGGRYYIPVETVEDYIPVHKVEVESR